MIKISSPSIGDEEVKAVTEVLRSGYLAYGPVAKEFEREFAKYIGVKHALAVVNGTIAIYAALKALGIGPGDEVVVPDFTFFATASMVVATGARPVFADIELTTYGMDPSSLEKVISERTKAVIVVHLYGHPARFDELAGIAREAGAYVIEDCAQAHGAEYHGKKVGSLGDVSAFSFYATKNMTMGEGGAVLTDNDEVAERVELLRNHGQVGRYNHVTIGWNFRITNIQAAIGLAQLRKLDRMNDRRREIARRYDEELSLIDALRTPSEAPWARHVYHLYTVWVEREEDRDKLAEYLRSKGIQAAVHYPKPLHLQQALAEYSRPGCCPVAEAASRHVLSLPMHPLLTDEEVEAVIRAVKEFFSKK